MEMIENLRIPFRNVPKFDCPHLKTNILLQYHLSRLEFPRVDYVTDLKSCLDQIIRIVQAAIDICADKALLSTAVLCINFMQMVTQARWLTDPDIWTVPHLNTTSCSLRLCQLMEKTRENLIELFKKDLATNQIDEVYDYLSRLPQIEISFKIRGFWSNKQETRNLPSVVNADQEYNLQIQLKRINRIRVIRKEKIEENDC